MSTGDRIRELRLKKGWSQKDLADKAGIREATVSVAERSKGKMQMSTLVAISSALGVSATEIMRDYEAKFFVTIDENAFVPKRAHESDAGFDLYSPIPELVPARGSAVIDTGVHIAIPKGYAGLICSKSGLNVNHGIISDGLIDSGYTGSIRVKLYNLSDTSYLVVAGDKISQIVFIPIVEPQLVEVDNLEETDRGDAGFGSTGR